MYLYWIWPAFGLLLSGTMKPAHKVKMVSIILWKCYYETNYSCIDRSIRMRMPRLLYLLHRQTWDTDGTDMLRQHRVYLFGAAEHSGFGFTFCTLSTVMYNNSRKRSILVLSFSSSLSSLSPHSPASTTSQIQCVCVCHKGTNRSWEKQSANICVRVV